MGHKGFDLLQRHTLPDGALHAYQAYTVLIFNELSDRTHPPVAEMINVINLALLIFQPHQISYRFNDIFLGQCFDRDIGINFQPA